MLICHLLVIGLSSDPMDSHLRNQLTIVIFSVQRKTTMVSWFQRRAECSMLAGASLLERARRNELAGTSELALASLPWQYRSELAGASSQERVSLPW